VDRIIDAGREHDVGKHPDPNSFRKLLRELWLEFGDVYDVKRNKLLGLKGWLERLRWEREAASKGFIWGEDYMTYVPDDAIILALLHHILDLCMYFLRGCSIERDGNYLMVEFAEQIFRNSYINELRGLVSTSGEPFNEVFRRLIDAVKSMSGQVYELLIKEP